MGLFNDSINLTKIDFDTLHIKQKIYEAWHRFLYIYYLCKIWSCFDEIAYKKINPPKQI